MYNLKKLITVILSSLLIFGGVATVLYPSASQWFTQKVESKAIDNLNGVMNQHTSSEFNNFREAANKYNDSIYRGLSTERFDYKNIIDTSGVGIIARVTVPSIKLDQTLKSTLDESVLQTGLGHLEGSSLPVGGVNTHAVIGGHRGLATAVGFTNLDKVSVGDDVIIESLGEVLAYKVTKTEVVEPGEAQVQPIIEGKDIVTLITCTPIGLNTQRIVVTAERLTPTPSYIESGKSSELPGFPWWAVGMGAAGLISFTFIIRGIVLHVKFKKNSKIQEDSNELA